MKRGFIFLIVLLAGLCSCETESPYSGYSVFFTCDAAFHPFNQMSGFGQFITIKRKSSTSYEITDVQGNVHIHHLSEAEARQQFYYGLGGLIIGTPSMQDGNIWAYDLACPNCDMARYRLKVNGVGHASCENCGSVFDMNIGGIPIEGKTRIMWRYRVFTSGTFVTVQN